MASVIRPAILLAALIAALLMVAVPAYAHEISVPDPTTTVGGTTAGKMLQRAVFIDGVHFGSPAYAKNDIDVGYLKNAKSCGTDCKVVACDYTANGWKARARAFNQQTPNKLAEVVDQDGAGGNCYFDKYGRNFEDHWTNASDNGGAGATSLHVWRSGDPVITEEFKNQNSADIQTYEPDASGTMDDPGS